VQVERFDHTGERDAARPELRPVREELIDDERLLVDQLLRTRRTEQRQPPAGELDLLLDQREA
jgi:hypothetical protein